MTLAVAAITNYPSRAQETLCLLKIQQPEPTLNNLYGLEATQRLMNVGTEEDQRNWLVDRLFNLANQPRRDLLLLKLILRADLMPLPKIYRLIEEAKSGIHNLSNLIENTSLLSRDCLDKLKSVLSKVEDGSLTFDRAIEAAGHIYWDGQVVDSALNLVWAPTWELGSSVLDLLLVAGLIDHNDIDHLQQSKEVPPTDLAKLLVSQGVLDTCTLEIATRVRSLLNQQRIALEQALSIVRFCLKYGVDVDSIILSCWPNN